MFIYIHISNIPDAVYYIPQCRPFDLRGKPRPPMTNGKNGNVAGGQGGSVRARQWKTT